MPHRRRAFREAGKSLHGVATPVLNILHSDPQLRGPLFGAGAWRLRIKDIDDLISHLSQIGRDIDRYAEGSYGDVEERHGSVPLQGWAPSLCLELIKLAALVVRWPNFGAWLPLHSPQGEAPPASTAQARMVALQPSPGTAGPSANGDTPSAAALARQELVSKLRQLGLSTLFLLHKMLRMAPLEVSCRLACALLRMHTLQACSRSLAQAVSCLKEAQAAGCPAPGPNAAAGAVGMVVGAGGASSAVPAGGASEQLLHTVRVSGPVLHGIAWVLSDLAADDDEGCKEVTALVGAKQDGGLGSAVTAESSNTSRGGQRGSDSGGRSSALRSQCAELVALLREALPGSGLVEHLARGVLHLLHSHDSCRRDAGEVFTFFLRAYGGFGAFLESSPELREVGNAALGGPCASYLATAGGLRLLCTADAGPSYGMLSSWAEAGILECWAGEAGGEGSGGEDSTRRGGDGGSTPGAAALPLTAMLYALLYQQPRRRVLTSVFERIGNAALAPARHAVLANVGGGGGGGVNGAAAGIQSSHGGSGDGSGGGSSGGRTSSGSCGGGGTSGSGTGASVTPPGLQLTREDADHLAHLALKLLQLHVQTLPAAEQLAPWRRWWRLACAWVSGAAHWPDETSVDTCVQMLQIDLGQLPRDGALTPMPPKPPLMLAAALSGGLLPCLERLVRRTGEAFRPGAYAATCSTEQQLLESLVSTGRFEYSLCWFLAYGRPTEVAALVLSLGKLLRVVAVDALPKEGGTLGVRPKLAPNVLLVTSFFFAAAYTYTAGAGAAGEGPLRQLRRMVALAACEWLPVMSGLVLEMARRLLAAWPAQQAQRSALLRDRWVQNQLVACLNACVVWLPTELGGAPKARDAGPSAQGVNGRGLRCWPELQQLVREARTVELVGAGMRLVAYLLCGGGLQDSRDREVWILPARQLLVAARRLAMHSPGEVRRALAAGPAAGVPAHCTWSSEVVRAMPRGLAASMEAIELGILLSAWERGMPPGLPCVDDTVRRGMLAEILSEAGQPCPLRRCSWWRCTHLAGDSEAGVERSKCGGCGGEWYCGRECQAAHWRAGHKTECGGKG